MAPSRNRRNTVLERAGYRLTIRDQIAEAFEDRVFVYTVGIVTGSAGTVVGAFLWGMFL